jgi:hypothetical protein
MTRKNPSSPPSSPSRPKLKAVNVVELPMKGRPRPPSGLSRAERLIWTGLVDDLPGGWLGIGGEAILKRAVIQISLAETIEGEMRKHADDGTPVEGRLQLARAHREAMAAIISALSAIRATPRARISPGSNSSRTARNRLENAPRGPRPWDRYGVPASDRLDRQNDETT